VIESLLKRLDLNANLGLDAGDVNDYWTKNLDRLLGVDDIAEWLEHAVQLPFDEVGSKFCANHVTGYDFPELVEDNGKRLETEIEITNPTHRRKIVRLINARLLGIESTLPEVKLDSPLVKCNRVTLTWEDVESQSAFPVHKYRVQRMSVPLTRGLVGEQTQVARGNVDGGAFSRGGPCDKVNDSARPVGDWDTVYEGPVSKYVDIRMEAGFEYTYRIEAWNAVGRSRWTSVDISTQSKWWKKFHGCPKELSNAHGTSSLPPNKSLNTWLQMFSAYYYFLSHIFGIVTIVLGYIIKSQRGNDPVFSNRYFTRIRESLNFVSRNIIKRDIFPKQHILMDPSMMPSGYGKVVEDRYSAKTPSKKAPEPTKKSQHKGHGSLESNPSLPENHCMDSNRNGSERHSMKDKIIGLITKFPKKKSTTETSVITTQSEEESEGVDIDHDDSSQDVNNKEDSRCPTQKEGSQGSVSLNGHHKRCNICKKKRKLGRFARHHCSKCGVTFCRKHGKCTHSKFTPCPVGSACICNTCQ